LNIFEEQFESILTSLADYKNTASCDLGEKFEQWGVESLAVELRNMLWIMPSGTDGQTVAEEGVALWSECLHYDPNTHTGDRLMALWLARECARRWSGSKGSKLDTQRR
jgi:hypothetical protein